MRRLFRLALLFSAIVGSAFGPVAAWAATNPRELVFVEGTDVVPLDPQFVHATPTFGVVRLINEGLVDLDPNMQIVPRLARSYDVSDDGTTWTTLASNVTDTSLSFDTARLAGNRNCPADILGQNPW